MTDLPKLHLDRHGANRALGAARIIVPRPATATPKCDRARSLLIAAACCWLAVTTPLALLDPGVMSRFGVAA